MNTYNIPYTWVTLVNKTQIPTFMDLHARGIMFSIFGRPPSEESHDTEKELTGSCTEELALEFITAEDVVV